MHAHGVVLFSVSIAACHICEDDEDSNDCAEIDEVVALLLACPGLGVNQACWVGKQLCVIGHPYCTVALAPLCFFTNL